MEAVWRWRSWLLVAGCCCVPEPARATLCNELTMLSEECQCDESNHRLTLRWANIHVSPLLSDLDRVADAGIQLYEMQIRDSDLEELKKEFPQFINEHVERLTLDNTHIGQVYVGDIVRPMKNLRSLQLENETIQQLEANMFDSLPLLEELAVNSAHLVSVRENTFVKLNLSRLWLRHNHLTQVPGAVSKLPYLRELDLFENRIEVVTDREALVLQSNLKHLRRLVMNSAHTHRSPLFSTKDRRACSHEKKGNTSRCSATATWAKASSCPGSAARTSAA